MKNLQPFHLFSEDLRSDMINYFNSFAEGISPAEATIEEMTGWIIRGVEIFKAGTYRGIEYTDNDLQEMADNFKALKQSQTFDPVFKKNHSERVEDQIGWIVNVEAQGDMLMADIHITDWEAYDKIKSKTWRYLSSEIYPPALAAEEFDDIDGYVLRGVAVVSVPKVKGLKGIILNSEILENQEEGKIMNREQMLKLLASVGVNFSEDEQKELTDEQLTKKFEETFKSFAENSGGSGEGAAAGSGQQQQQQAQTFSEGGIVQMSADEFVNLSKKFSELEGQVQNFSETVTSLKKDSKKHGIEKRVDALVKSGKVLPAEKDEIMAFAEDLNDAQSEKYFASLEKRPAVVEFGESGGAQGADDDDDIDATLKAVNSVKTYE